MRALEKDKDKRAHVLEQLTKQVSKLKAKKLGAAQKAEILARAQALRAAVGCPVAAHSIGGQSHQRRPTASDGAVKGEQ